MNASSFIPGNAGHGITCQSAPESGISARAKVGGKYSEIVWSPGASAQVRGKMMRHQPQYFRIVTGGAPLTAGGWLDEQANVPCAVDKTRTIVPPFQGLLALARMSIGMQHAP